MGQIAFSKDGNKDIFQPTYLSAKCPHHSHYEVDSQPLLAPGLSLVTCFKQRFHWGLRPGHKKPCSSSLGVLEHCILGYCSQSQSSCYESPSQRPYRWSGQQPRLKAQPIPASGTAVWVSRLYVSPVKAADDPITHERLPKENHAAQSNQEMRNMGFLSYVSGSLFYSNR